MSDEHVYGLDGIKEENNRFPLWLGFCYVLLHIWGVYYLINFWTMPGDQIRSEVVNTSLGEKTFANLKERNALHDTPSFTEDNVTQGKEVYIKIAGDRDLASEYYSYGSSIGSISNAVKNGIPGTAMAPWKDILTDEEIYSLVAYLDSANPNRQASAHDSHGTSNEAAHGNETNAESHETAGVEHGEDAANEDNSHATEPANEEGESVGESSH